MHFNFPCVLNVLNITKILHICTQGDDEDEEGVQREGDREPGEDGEQEEAPEEPQETRIDVELPKLQTSLGDEMHFVKLPNFLSVEAR